jgi:hypothetical protein
MCLLLIGTSLSSQIALNRQGLPGNPEYSKDFSILFKKRIDNFIIIFG